MQMWLCAAALAAYCIALARTQKTYQRTCDCEYTADGKCAYTLVLPAGGGTGGNQQCPNDKAVEQDTSKVQGQLELFKVNITDLRMTTGDQAMMLSQVQSLVMAQQTTLSELADKVRTASAASSKSSSSSSSCEVCTEVQEKLRVQQVAMESLQKQLIETQTTIGQLGEAFNKVGDAVWLQMDQMNKLLENQKNQTEGLQRAIGEALAAATAPAAGLCFRRGLLVSGTEQNVTNDAITASSRFNDGHGAVRGRIFTQADLTFKGAWCAGENRTTKQKEEPNDLEEWLQFDLGKMKTIFGIVTKGRSDYGQWVTTYSLNYTNADPTSDMTSWTSHMNVLGEKVIFTGNMDRNTAKMNMLWQPIRARYIRVIPLTSDSNKCMRADVIGCLDDQ